MEPKAYERKNGEIEQSAGSLIGQYDARKKLNHQWLSNIDEIGLRRSSAMRQRQNLFSPTEQALSEDAFRELRRLNDQRCSLNVPLPEQIEAKNKVCSSIDTEVKFDVARAVRCESSFRRKGIWRWLHLPFHFSLFSKLRPTA